MNENPWPWEEPSDEGQDPDIPEIKIDRDFETIVENNPNRKKDEWDWVMSVILSYRKKEKKYGD